MMTATENPNITMAALRAFTRNAQAIAAQKHLVAARATALVVRAHVDAYITPVFAAFDFYDDKPRRGAAALDKAAPRITTPANLYLSNDDAACERFYALCDAAHRAHGYDVAPGVCPALVAEHAVITAENALLAIASQAFGFDFTQTYGAYRIKALDIFAKMPKP